jgi:hypothetical protein
MFISEFLAVLLTFGASHACCRLLNCDKLIVLFSNLTHGLDFHRVNSFALAMGPHSLYSHSLFIY